MCFSTFFSLSLFSLIFYVVSLFPFIIFLLFLSRIELLRQEFIFISEKKSDFCFSFSNRIVFFMSTKKPTRAILIPGNGLDEDEDMNEVMWYGDVAQKLREAPFSLEFPLKVFPDPLYAREHIWTAFAVNDLKLDENTLIIGHSSGAACCLRLMEKYKTAGCVLVSAYDSDLGDKIERESGYFSRPFDYEKMRENTPFIIQFHAVNDHLVPVSCARRVAKGLSGGGAAEGENDEMVSSSKKFTYIEHQKSGHFQFDEAPWLIDALKEQLLAKNHQQ
jgi:predicted alpha/beta hydrolase family esterase